MTKIKKNEVIIIIFFVLLVLCCLATKIFAWLFKKEMTGWWSCCFERAYVPRGGKGRYRDRGGL